MSRSLVVNEHRVSDSELVQVLRWSTTAEGVNGAQCVSGVGYCIGVESLGSILWTVISRVSGAVSSARLLVVDGRRLAQVDGGAASFAIRGRRTILIGGGGLINEEEPAHMLL